MRIQDQKIRLISLIALIAVLAVIMIASIIYIQRAIYTSNLSSRPFNIGLTSNLENLEPALIDNHGLRLVSAAIYEGMVVYDENSQSIQPRLAKSWKYKDKGKSIIINLRKDIKFSNGKKLTASDVKTSWEHNFSRSRDWSNISMYLTIAGSSEKLAGKSSEISGIKVLNPHTLKIIFARPNAAFISSLSNPAFWVMDLGAGLNPPPGTGPYVLKENQPQSLVLLKNDLYYRGQPHLSALIVAVFPDAKQAFKAYQEGKIDFLDDIPGEELANIRSKPDYKGLLIEKPVLETYCLGFNMGRDPYAGSYLLRRALNYAIDREYIIKNILGGSYIVAKAVIPTGLDAYSKRMYGYRYDPDKARQLLEESGHPQGQGLSTLTLTYNKNSGHSQVATEIARQLAQYGITVQLQEQNWDYYKKQVNGRYISFFRLGWAADYPDADNFLYSLFHSSKIGVSNFCGYHNPQLDRILDASRSQYKDPAARIKLLQRAEEIIVDDAPCLWLFQKKAEKLISPDVRKLTLDKMEMVDWYQVELAKPSIDKTSDNRNSVKTPVPEKSSIPKTD